MNFLELIAKRRSIRVYEQMPVEEAKLEAILEAANASPSAGNLQAYEVVVVTDPGQRRELSQAALGQPQVAAAPVVLVFVADPSRAAKIYGRRGEDLYAVQDATIACAYAELAATALGLSGCWIGAFEEARVGVAVGLSDGCRAVAMLTVGYAAEAPTRRGRRPLDDLVRWGSHALRSRRR
jgi:nitroreductase